MWHSVSALFGKYRLVQHLGGGRLTEVYRVGRSWSGGSTTQALKRLVPALAAQPDFVDILAREARLIAGLSHPNLCPPLELGVVDGCAFMTLELVEGCTLRAVMRRLARMGRRMPPGALLTIATDLCTVLDYLHRESPAPLAHLDLSPQNVLIDSAGKIKLVDFGIARRLDGSRDAILGGKIAGTVGYMAPEQAAAEPRMDVRADQFGLGVLLWELQTGRRLFRGGSGEAAWQLVERGRTPAAVFSALEGADHALRDVITTMLQARPADRFAHIGQALKRLRTASAQTERAQLSELVSRLMSDPSFDRYDASARRTAPPAPALPDWLEPALIADASAKDYLELKIEVDHGVGTPSAIMRAVAFAADNADSYRIGEGHG